MEQTTQKKYDEVGAIMAYENDSLSMEDTIELFQHLVNNGMAWTLQGHYGRVAQCFIDSGQIEKKIPDNDR